MKKSELKKTIQEFRETVDSLLKENANVYHNTFSSAVQFARSEAEKRGFEINEDDWFNQITTGAGKPSIGKTTKANVGLLKNGKETNKKLSIQVHGMPKGSFELNFYIQ